MFRQLHLHGRVQSIFLAASVFLVINFITRLTLFGYESIEQGILLTTLPGIIFTGFIYDIAALAYVIIPFLLLAIIITNGPWGRRVYIILTSVLFVAMVGTMLFVLVSELIFWNEFTSRFNFIAVDYLIYTREVLGNIRESYPAGWVFAGIGVVTLAIIFLLRYKWWKTLSDTAALGKTRLVLLLTLVLLPTASYTLVGDGPSERLQDSIARELAGNGYYDFLRAFRNNDLDYFTFYRTMPIQQAEAILQEEYEEGAGKKLTVTGQHEHTFPREIKALGSEKKLNVILVSIESLGTDYIESFGGRPGLTPNLDKLSAQGLMMTNTYATGLRTVRGLEALSLSIPPTPGQAVLKRKNNKGLQTIGSIFKDKGYDVLYLYGGYSYFDNMSDFFSGNGYEVIDRTDIDDKNITHENIWGVADEDLYHKTIREIDRRVAAGRKVFAQVMTTSNHRPFSYPSGRIDIPSGTGREGAVKYTDWAIGNFIKEASSRSWFKDTVFVFVADHTSNGRGHTDLPPENYHIPLIFYSPGNIKPGKIQYLMSQIDVAPTLLGMLNFNYDSYLFGEDILNEQGRHQRALMANYLTVGYMQDNVIVELQPNQRVNVLDATTGENLNKDTIKSRHLIDEAIAYYEMATDLLDKRSVR
ncbi:MAG: LTA synthase family protein [Gammaproteobacteria bacterium]|nr:MAG: LTA synthase family protein [Gammaproteobacteria bacterium]